MSKIDEVIQLLKHDDAEQRRLAINWLAKNGDEKALKALVWSYQNDRDPAIKELAKKGAYYLKQQLDNQAAVVEEPYKESDALPNYGFEPTYADEDDEVIAYENPPEIETGQSGKVLSDRAKALIKQAMDLHIEGEDAKAISTLLKALDHDPATQYDTAALRVATAITGKPGDEAIRELANPERRKSLVGELTVEEKVKRGDGPSWGTTGADIGIFGLINAVGSILVLVLAASRLSPLLYEVSRLADYQEIVRESGEDVIAMLLNALENSIIVLVILGIVYAIYVLITTLISNFATHFAAITIFEGKRPSAVTVDRLINVQSIVYVLGYAAIIGIILLLPNNLETYNTESGQAIFGGLILSMACVFGLGGIGSAIAQSFAVGRAQEFGFFKGCLSIIIGSVILGMLNFVFQMVINLLVVATNAMGG